MAEPAAPLVELDLLKPIDTLHDFWSNQRGDDIRDILENVTYGTENKKFQAIIDYIATQGIKINDIENTGAAYFEKKINLPSIVDDNIITIDATNTADNNANNLVNYLNNEAVQIILPHDIDEEYDLGYLATFIRQFMFGGEGDNIGFVIDANHGKLPQIFKTDKQVKTVLNALVVGDSANTPKEHSNSRFYERLTPNKFPFYNPLPREVTNNTGDLYEVDQSPFFSSLINFYYQETLPGSFADNITAFKLVVENKKDKTTQYGEAYFSPTTTQGASVDTLKKLIQIVKNNENNNVFASELANMEYPAKQLDIRSIVRNMRISNFPKNEIVNFLLDYKRAGDYEQINSAKVIADKKEEKIIFSTGDQLCALYARSQGLPCIYNHAGKMDLYTFAAVKESLEEQQAKQIKKYEGKKAYYEKYKNFFNIIPPETLAALIQDYLAKIDAYVRTQIPQAAAAYFINGTMHAYKTALGYSDEPPSAVLNGIMGSLTRIIAELEEKIKVPIIASNDTSEIAKKIQQFLDIVDKIVENIAAITLEEIQKKMTEQTRKIYEIDNNFFNHQFDSHKLFASFYENFQADAKEEKKVAVAQKYKEDAESTLAKYITDKNRKIPDQEKRVNGAILALYAAKNKYESKIMAQIKAMNDEIEKIYQNYDELIPEGERFTSIFKEKLNNFNKEIEADKGDKFNASVIIAKYKEFIARITTPVSAVQSAAPVAAANAPDEEDVFFSQPSSLEGGGNLDEEEEIKIISGLETALLTLGDYCATMFTALHKEYENNKKDKVKQIEFKTYLKHVYEELYALEQEAKKRDRELSKILNNKIQFNIDGELYDTIRTDYVKYINTLISEFNGTIIENMPPTLKPDEYNAKIKEILRGSGNSQFIVLLYESAEAEGGDTPIKRKRVDDVTEEESEDDEIDLHALFYLTCENKHGKIIEKFKNFDDYKINPSSFAGGGTFKQASKKIRLMKSVVEAFKTFKQIKEEKIKERENRNQKTQDKWASIKRIASPMILVKEASAIAATKRLRTLSPSPVPGEEPIKTKRGKQTPSPAPARVKSRRRRITYGPGGPTPGPTPTPEPVATGTKRGFQNLSPLSEELAVVGGKKRTRKYKNRENKKTNRRRQRNKNQKNKTQKNKRKGRKHKTRRHY
jgi:hypothetical protein